MAPLSFALMIGGLIVFAYNFGRFADGDLYPWQAFIPYLVIAIAMEAGAFWIMFEGLF
jgi:hypothetical protein